jgi:FixH
MNWGNKLLVTFIVFGTGMSYLVYRSMNVNYELVEKDYYKNELRYQQVIDGTKRANALATPVTFQQSGQNIELQLPAEMKSKAITGDIWFYCAYDETRDRKFSLQIDSEANQSFSKAQFRSGTYTVKISWKEGENQYYSENKLSIL